MLSQSGEVGLSALANVLPHGDGLSALSFSVSPLPRYLFRIPALLCYGLVDFGCLEVTPFVPPGDKRAGAH